MWESRNLPQCPAQKALQFTTCAVYSSHTAVGDDTALHEIKQDCCIYNSHFHTCRSKRIIHLILRVLLNIQLSQDSIVSIATCYGLDDRGVRVRVPVGSRIFSSPIVQTRSGVHPISYTMDTGGYFTAVKRPGREADHSRPTSAEVKKMDPYIQSSVRLHGVVLN
jgi:hypothetical protein